MATQEGAFVEWLHAQLDRRGWSAADLHRASKISQANVSRWMNGETVPSLDNARTLAHALGRPVLEVLVAADLLTPEEARQKTTAQVDPTTLSNRELLQEVGRRMAEQDHADVTSEQVHAKPGRFVSAGKSTRRKAAGDTVDRPDTQP